MSKMGSKFEKYIQEQLLRFVNEHEREIIGIYNKKTPTGYSYLRGGIGCEAGIVHEVEKIRQDFNYPSLVQHKIARIKPKFEKKFIEIFMSTISLDKFDRDTLSVECSIYPGYRSFGCGKKGSMYFDYRFCPTQFFYNNSEVRDEWYFKFKNNDDIQRIIQEIRKEINGRLRSATCIDSEGINNIRFSTFGYSSLNEHQTKMLALLVYDELQYDYIRYSQYDGCSRGCYYLTNEDKTPQKEW